MRQVRRRHRVMAWLVMGLVGGTAVSALVVALVVIGVGLIEPSSIASLDDPSSASGSLSDLAAAATIGGFLGAIYGAAGGLASSVIASFVTEVAESLGTASQRVYQLAATGPPVVLTGLVTAGRPGGARR